MKPSCRSVFVSWIGSLLLAGCLISCVPEPDPIPSVSVQRGVTAVLFKVEGVVGEESFRGLRAMLQLDESENFVLSLMTAMNQPVAVISHDGQGALLVDYRNRQVFRDTEPPVNFHEILKIDLDLGDLVRLFREFLATETGRYRNCSWGTAIVNDNGVLVGLLNDGSRLLLTPLDEPKRNPAGRLPAVTIPEGYRMYETDQYSQ